MLLIVKVLLWGLAIALILIPIARWFWKRFDAPDKETVEYIEEMKQVAEERKIWQEVEAYDAAVQEVREKWTKSKITEAPDDDVKAAAMQALADVEVEIPETPMAEDNNRMGPSAPPDPELAAAAKAGAKVVEKEADEAENLLRQEGELPPEDIGKGAEWKEKPPSDQGDWGDVTW